MILEQSVKNRGKNAFFTGGRRQNNVEILKKWSGSPWAAPFLFEFPGLCEFSGVGQVVGTSGTLTFWRPKRRLGIQKAKVQELRCLGLQNVKVQELRCLGLQNVKVQELRCLGLQNAKVQELRCLGLQKIKVHKASMACNGRSKAGAVAVAGATAGSIAKVLAGSMASSIAQAIVGL